MYGQWIAALLPVDRYKVTRCSEVSDHGRPHGGQMGSADPRPGKMDEKIKKAKTCNREQSGQAVVENGAMLTTYLFRYTSECTIS